jgi:predicted metalloprotease with PDZ domain
LVQVRYGLITRKQYLDVIKEKMGAAMFQFNDTLPFTELSKGCLDIYKDQYTNVYAKGMLISMCLDIELLHLSQGKYGLMSLIQDLAKLYGKDKAFKDDELRGKIVSLTYPEIGTFFDNYIAGSKPLPYDKILGYAGVDYIRSKKVKSFSLGQCDLGYNPATSRLKVAGISKMNDFGKALGYKVGDEFAELNGVKLSPMSFMELRQEWLNTVKEGDKVKLTVYRTNAKGKQVKKVLKAKAFKTEVTQYNTLEFNPAANDEQLAIKKAWLEGVSK